MLTMAQVDGRMSIRGFRASFLFVVSLFAAVAGFTLWDEVRTNEQEDKLVTRALTRDVLIGRMRVDALNLESAVDTHIRASTEQERNTADQRMAALADDLCPPT